MFDESDEAGLGIFVPTTKSASFFLLKAEAYRHRDVVLDDKFAAAAAAI